MSDRLEVNILGSSEGESIALRTPDGRWGVVDSFGSDDNPTRQLLNERGVTELEFICLTHPHRDHFQGMSELIDVFNPKKFWVFNATAPEELFASIADILEIKAEGSHDATEQRNEATEFVTTIRMVNARRKERRLDLVYLQLGLPLIDQTVAGIPFKAVALGPSSNATQAYEQMLAQCFDHTNPNRFLASRLPYVDHNSISAGILFEFGESRIVLGSDMESAAWQAVIEYDAPRLPLQSDLVKVSHHGSVNGFCPGLWEEHLSPNGQCVAVITPFLKKRLPRPEGIAHIRGASEAIAVPSLSSIRPSPPASLGTDLPAEGRIALDAVFRRLRPNTHARGVCSFSVYHDGSFDVQFDGDAGFLG